MLLYSYISRFTVNHQHQQKGKIWQNYCHKFYPQPLFISLFNFSHKRPTFAFTGESGYTLGSLRKIAHSALHAETGVLHSCEAERNISLPPPRAKEQPEEADTRLLRVSASSGTAAPLGCATLFAIWRCYCFFALHAGLPTCAR